MQLDLSDLVASMPFSAGVGVTLDHAEPGEVRGRLDWDASRCTVAGALHGGALMTLADSVGAICAFLDLPRGAATSTIESKTNFFRAVRSGRVTATARPLHVGRTTVAVQTEVRDADDRLVALTTQTQAVITKDTR